VLKGKPNLIRIKAVVVQAVLHSFVLAELGWYCGQSWSYLVRISFW